MEIKDLIQTFKKEDNKKLNLSKRSKNIPASSFDKWDNPEDADGVPILARTKVTASDPNVKTTFNNFATVQRTKAGYMAGNIKRDFSDKILDDLKNKYISFDNLNHTKRLWKKLMFACTGWGNTYTLCYLDTKKQVRIKQIKSWQAKVIYDDNDEPIQGYVYYPDPDNKDQEVVYYYDDLIMVKYVKPKNGKDYQKAEEGFHGFKQMPLVEWVNNDNKMGNAQIAVSLMDAYDRLMSDNITEWATFRNAYLLLKNMGLIDEAIKEELQKTGILTADGDNSEAKFITKDVNPEFVKFVTSETWSGIWTVASSVDPKALASLSNATAFQIAQLYRNMEEDCQDTELEWVASFEYLDRILQSYWTGLDLQSVNNYLTEDISYELTRNIPKDVMTWLKDMIAAGGKLPQKEIFKKAGYTETEAETLVSEAENETYDEIPDPNDIGD